MIKVEG